MIMTLGAKNGDTVEVESDDQAAVDTIAALVEQDLDAYGLGPSSRPRAPQGEVDRARTPTARSSSSVTPAKNCRR